jgi:hypothetical protein
LFVPTNKVRIIIQETDERYSRTIFHKLSMIYIGTHYLNFDCKTYHHTIIFIKVK